MTKKIEHDLQQVVMRHTDQLLAVLLGWQLDLAIPDTELQPALQDIQLQGDANAADLFNEVRWTLWSVIRSAETLSKLLHTDLDYF